MKILVLVEPVDGNGFQAHGGAPFELTSVGATREEALAKLQAQVVERLNAGAEIHSFEVAPSENPWITYAGMFKNDPLLDEWEEAMADYRKSVEEDSNYQ